MICDKNGVIIKLDGKSVIEFLRENKKPLIIYGMGKKGKFALEAMDQLSIKVSMVVDSDKRKQNTMIKGRRIADINNAKEQYQDALVWITIADDKIRIPLEKKLHELGFFPIMTFDIQDPLSEQAYLAIDENYPYFLVGKNRYSNELQEYLRLKKCKIVGIEEDITTIGNVYKNFEKTNIIICDETILYETVCWLHKQNIFENIYLNIRGDFGKFRIEKYSFIKAKLRYIVKFFLAALNGMNQQMINESSKKNFQEINYRYIRFLINNKNIMLEEVQVCQQLAELRNGMRVLYNGPEEMSFQSFEIDLREDVEDIFSYLNFLSKIYECCICFKKKISIEKKNDFTFEIGEDVMG